MLGSDIRCRTLFLLKMLGVAALYALFAHASHLYAMSHDSSISAVWPSSGLALAAVLMGGKRYAASVLIGSLLMANVMAAGEMVWADLAIALGNTLAVLLGAWLLMRKGRFDPSIASLNDYLRLILLGGCLASLVSASTGSTALLASGFIAPAEYLYSLLRWWMGDVLGIILMTPLIMSCSPTEGQRSASLAGVSEAVLLFGLMFFAGQIVFLDWFHDSVGTVAKVYWIFLFIIWVALRFGVRGVSIALLMTAIQALWGAHYDVGFFEHDIAETQLANFWLYMVALSVVGMALATYFAEHRKAEEALRRSETRLKALYDSTSDAVMLLDEQGFFDCNRATLAMFGCVSKEQFCEKHPADLSPSTQPCGADSMMLARQRISEAMEKGSHFFEWMHRRADTDAVFPADVLLNSMVLDGKKVIQATVRDISPRKDNEAKIVRLSRAYHLLSRVNEAIVRAQDRSSLFSTICNAAIESELFRFVWIGMLDDSAVSPVAYAGVEQGYTEKLDIRLDDEHRGNGPTGRAIREARHIICDDIGIDPRMAPWRDAALQRGYRASGVFPILEAGAVVGTINVYAAEAYFFTPDIIASMLELAADLSFALEVFAEKKRRELAEHEIKRLNVELEYRVLERTRQLEVANKELEAFCYSVSHDLRAPLRSIDGFSRVLSNKYHDQLDAVGQDWLGRVCRASQHMGHLIDDMLKLSVVARGALKRKPVDLSKIAENVADNLRNTDTGRQVQFILQQEISVQGDPGLLGIVMDNLMGNAYKFTSKKTDTEIEFGVRDIDGEREFFVRDNGDGFNMEHAHKLFGVFQRLHTSNEFEGTGIGLATVQRIIHRHHGRVWAEAKAGQGATFYFTLPQRERGT